MEYVDLMYELGFVDDGFEFCGVVLLGFEVVVGIVVVLVCCLGE